MSGDRPPVVFALDAGATSTRVLVVDGAGTILWRTTAGGASITRLGIRGAAQMVADLWQKAGGVVGVEELGNLPIAIAGGFAGARSTVIQDEMTRALRIVFQPAGADESLPISITHDAHIALVGAVGEKGPGCVLISGTGSICIVRDEEGSTALSGGWGWPLGDEGSATWVGWKAVQGALAAWEEGSPTELTELVLDAWGLGSADVADSHELMRLAAEAGLEPARYAALAPAVFDLAMGGNPDAKALVVETGRALGEMVVGACGRLGRQPGVPLPLAFMGSLAKAWETELEEPVRAGAGVFAPDLCIVPPLMPAEGGAAFLAYAAAGLTLDPEAVERLCSQLAGSR